LLPAPAWRRPRSRPSLGWRGSPAFGSWSRPTFADGCRRWGSFSLRMRSIASCRKLNMCLPRTSLRQGQ
jgi:hypothetical protein